MLRIISKEIVSSHNIRFSEDLNQDIEYITGVVTDFYINKKNHPDIVPFKIQNDYSGQIESVKVVINPQITSDGVISVYNTFNNTMSIFPNNVDKLYPDDKNRISLFNIFKKTIQHEFVHAIDPKMRRKRPKVIPGSSQYYSSPVEYDAYSKQIIEELRVKMSTNPSIIRTLKNWLRSSNAPLGPISTHSYVLKYWQESDKLNNTDRIRRFKHRVYNELITNKGVKNDNKISE